MRNKEGTNHIRIRAEQKKTQNTSKRVVVLRQGQKADQ